MKTAGVSPSAYSPWCPAPGQRLGPARTSWLAPSVSSSRRRASARSGAEIAGDLAGRGFAGPAEADTAMDPGLWCDVTKDPYLSCARA